MSAELFRQCLATLPGNLQLSPKRRCNILHFWMQLFGKSTCKKQSSGAGRAPKGGGRGGKGRTFLENGEGGKEEGEWEAGRGGKEEEKGWE